MQKFLTQMKYLGLRMYHLAFATESLFTFMANPKACRSSIGSTYKQDENISEWPVSSSDDPARMINFLRASLMREDEEDHFRCPRIKRCIPRHVPGCGSDEDEVPTVRRPVRPAFSLSMKARSPTCKDGDVPHAPKHCAGDMPVRQYLASDADVVPVSVLGTAKRQSMTSVVSETTCSTDTRLDRLETMMTALLTRMDVPQKHSSNESWSRPSSAQFDIEEEFRATATAQIFFCSRHNSDKWLRMMWWFEDQKVCFTPVSRKGRKRDA